MSLLFVFFSFFTQSIDNQQVADSNFVLIRKIEIRGNYRTKENVILRELAIHQGDTLQQRSLKEIVESDRQKVLNLNLFVTVNFVLKNQANNAVDIIIELKERWYYVVLPTFYLTDRNFSDWWYNHRWDFKRANYGIYASNSNLTGRNDKLRLIVESGFIPNFSLAYTSGYLDKAQHYNVGVGVAYALSRTLAFQTENDQLDYLTSENRQRESWSAYGSISHRKGFYQFHSFTLSYNDTKIADTIATLNPNYLLNAQTRQRFLAASYTYQYDHRDSKQYALKGERFVAQATQYFQDVTISAATSSYTQYFPLGGKFYANYSLRGKVSFPKKQPYLQTLGLGYRADYVRGYELYVVDGQSYALLKTNLKYQLFNHVFDLHKLLKVRQFNTLPVAAYLNSFLDMGYARNAYAEASNSRLANNLLIGAGVGLDLVSWYNYVGRLNYALNRMGEGRIYFSAGREF